MLVLRFAGLNYHHPSAGDAWRRILGFFDVRLRTGATTPAQP